ncbi:MAG: hypothetical protein IPK32_06945 [Verrucomicrobiaceae bacterium]|nr:hypothetical protein [Verrucomicrobiaceae bacterium]
MAFSFGMVTFFADFGLPAMWTTMQDISGKYQAQLFGWGNMWGNFGAALLPLIFTKTCYSTTPITTTTKACGSAPSPLCSQASSASL